MNSTQPLELSPDAYELLRDIGQSRRGRNIQFAADLEQINAAYDRRIESLREANRKLQATIQTLVAVVLLYSAVVLAAISLS